MQRNKKMKNIHVMPTVKEHTGNKMCITCRNNAGEERARAKDEKGLGSALLWIREDRAEMEATVNGSTRNYLKENEWTRSSKVATRSNKEDEIYTRLKMREATKK